MRSRPFLVVTSVKMIATWRSKGRNTDSRNTCSGLEEIWGAHGFAEPAHGPCLQSIRGECQETFEGVSDQFGRFLQSAFAGRDLPRG
jgi:hypothetical protein